MGASESRFPEAISSLPARRPPPLPPRQPNHSRRISASEPRTLCGHRDGFAQRRCAHTSDDDSPVQLYKTRIQNVWPVRPTDICSAFRLGLQYFWHAAFGRRIPQATPKQTTPNPARNKKPPSRGAVPPPDSLAENPTQTPNPIDVALPANTAHTRVLCDCLAHLFRRRRPRRRRQYETAVCCCDAPVR